MRKQPPRRLLRQRRIEYLWVMAAELVCSSTTTTSAKPYNDHSYDTDSFLIGIDNHASYSMTNNKDDFIGTPTKVNVRVKGIQGHSTSALKGTVQWDIHDDDGQRHSIVLPNTYYIESLPLRLLSPQHFAQVRKNQETSPTGTVSYTTADSVVLMWHNQRYQRTVRLNSANVAVFRSAPGYTTLMAFDHAYNSHHRDPCGFATHLIPPESPAPAPDPPTTPPPSPTSSPSPPPSSDAAWSPGGLGVSTMSTSVSASPNNVNDGNNNATDTNQNNNDASTASFNVTEPVSIPLDDNKEQHQTPSNSSDELLMWHYRLGHKSFLQLQAMARSGDLPRRLATCKVPKCAACRLGKATKVPWRSKGEDNRRQIHTATEPGQCVSIDQMQSTTPGLIGQMTGFLTKKRYHHVTIFVDHYSRLTFTYAHQRITAADTVVAKLAFEAYAKSLGVVIRHYHADNGRFADKEFVLSVKEQQQTISYCGVNAHWQNGIAEKRIRDLQEAARSQIIHAKSRWPKAVDPSLWPYAIRYSAAVSNATIGSKASESPYEKFAKISVRPKLRHFHPFGCPAYVLKDKYHQGGPVPKWESRARVGLYLGPSPRHARSVALILSLDTGHVSPQYHVRFDDFFETVKEIDKIVAYKWRQKCHFEKAEEPPTSSSEKTQKQEFVSPTLESEGAATSPIDQHESTSQNYSTTSSTQAPILPTQDSQINVTSTQDANHAQDHNENSNPSRGNNTGNPTQGTTSTTTSRTTGSHTAGRVSNEQPQHLPTITTRSGRKVKRTQRMQESLSQRLQGAVAYVASLPTDAQNIYLEKDAIAHLDDPIAAMKATNDPDTMYHHEAMKEPDAEQFKLAMVKEVNDHTNRRHWVVVLRTDVPVGVTILPAVWAMKRKRRIATGLVYKWKARLNLGGHKQFIEAETFAPALTWTVIRLFLTLSVILGWHSRQVDFVLAYPQAEIPRPTYMELPRGINIPGLDRSKHVLKVLRNIYGGKDAGRTWYLHLKERLESIGFIQSKFDECVFYRNTTIFIVYTDDGIFFDPKKENIDDAIADMAKILNIDDQGDISDYLGVKVDKVKTGGYELTQPQLIDSILLDLDLIHPDGTARPGAKTRPIPALYSKIIGPDRQGEDFNFSWKYRTLIGKLNYLEKSTRPDLAYPVHQCARFMADPKKSHGEAVKRIGRYLLHTRKKGYFIRPMAQKGLECYVDASYLGDWDKTIAMDDPATAKSRGAFVIKYAGVPLYWQSKILTQIALSSSEAEYLALSAAARYVKSVMYLLEEINRKVTKVYTTPTMKCTIFEDNTAAIEIARVPKVRPRTRHLNVAYHHFRNEVANGRIKIQAIGTDHQDADMLTKQCEQWRFERHRKNIMGW